MAGLFDPLLRAVLGGAPPVRFEFWDGSFAGPRDGADLVKVLRTLQGAASNDARLGVGAAVSALGVARRLGALGLPLPAPPEEARSHGRRHSKRRDAAAIGHHYDAGNEFYRLFLGPSLTYSCARFTEEHMSLEAAQTAKHELISRKLGLADRPGLRVLDIGCGWGSMALHAATRHGAEVVEVTISAEQAASARERVAEAGLSGRVEIRLQDYRDLPGETFDAVSSVGMFEHVGAARTAEYFAVIRALLRRCGRLLNHAISSVGGSVMGRKSFIARYVFPDGELLDAGEVVLAMERAGFEVRDVESLREHYARTLRCWVANLESNWDEAVALVGKARADLAAVHGRRRAGLLGRRHRRPPGPRRRPRSGRCLGRLRPRRSARAAVWW